MDAHVAVITRTKNRPILLPRAFESVRGQTYKDFIWVIVNDGGDHHPVDEIIGKAQSAQIKTKVIHNTDSIGMEAASNKGIKQVGSEYVTIHDDDDTWEPHFLERTVAFLDEQETYDGVITHSTAIDEVVTEEGWKIVGRSPFNAWRDTVNLSDLAQINNFPPISFLFRRRIYEDVKGFNESLPVLGDWDFNLRFLLRADIGVIPEPLANYHWRVELSDNQLEYANTVSHGVAQHISYNTLIRNRYLREDLKEGRVGLGLLLAMGRNHRRLNDRISELFDRQVQLADCQSQLADSQSQLANSQSQLADSQSQLADSQSQLADFRAELEIFHQSRSWKLTAPLRYAYDLLRRILK
ncbi:MAG: glycosyltransferase [Deltaproteobacteria bacterium]|nr:glycosyltransferase [Deltaproteobacteria bacterium]